MLNRMSDHQLAQLNIGILKAPLDDPATAEFVAMLDPINALADSSPGFVWRYTDEGSNDATAARPFGGDIIVNFSVWRDPDSLWNFTYRTDHLDLLRRRREWFTRMSAMHQVMWWIPAGRIPGIDDGRRRLELLRSAGPSPDAFTFAAPFPPPGSPDAAETAGTAASAETLSTPSAPAAG